MSVAEKPRHHVILTIGMNPVPCLVAAYRLCEHYRKLDGGRLPTVTALYSKDYEDEAKRILDALSKRLAATLDDHWLRFALRDPRDPADIVGRMKEIIDYFDSAGTFHLNYTAGTKAMAVHAVQELMQSKLAIQISYLDAEKHRMLLPDGKLPHAPDDERDEWQLSPKEVAELHGYKTHSRPPLGDPLRLGTQMFKVLSLREHGKKFADSLSAIRNIFGRKFEKPERLPEDPIAWPSLTHPDWDTVSAAVAHEFGEEELLRKDPDTGRWFLYYAGFDNRTAIVKLHKFLDGTWYELGAYERLQSALKALQRGYKVFHSMYFGPADRPFKDEPEADVVTVVGYQLVLLSCSASADRKTIKLKAFEALHRARQIGGDGARALVLCMMNNDKKEVDELTADVQDDIGIKPLPVQIWGVNQMEDLTGSFKAYLQNDLKVTPCTTTANA